MGVGGWGVGSSLSLRSESIGSRGLCRVGISLGLPCSNAPRDPAAAPGSLCGSVFSCLATLSPPDIVGGIKAACVAF